MKIYANVYELKNALAIAEKGITANKLDNSKGMLFFKPTETKELILISHGNVVVTNKIAVEMEGKLDSFCVDGKLFTEFVKRCATDTIKLNITEKYVELKSGAMTTKFLKSYIDLPPIQTKEDILEKGNIVIVGAEEFVSITSNVLSCVSKDNTRPILQGLNFKPNSANNEVQVCGCDGFRLSLGNIEVNKCDFTITILGKAISIINSIIASCSEKTISFYIENNKLAYFIIGNSLVRVPLFSEDFIKYEKLLPTNEKYIIVNAKELKNATETVQLVAKNNQMNTILIEIENNKLKLSAQSEISDCQIELAKENNNEFYGFDNNFKIACNAQFLIDAVKTITDETVKLTFGTNNMKPFTVEGEKIYSMILPVRIQ